MKRAVVTACLSIVAGAAHGQVTLEPIAQGYAGLDISADGNAMAGNRTDNGSYDAFRWTRTGGITLLGRSTSAVFGTGAGTPNISNDGTRVSAQIVDATATFMTPGLWIEGTGWIDVFPPLLPDGGFFDNSYGSCWALSGDGLTIGGFYWRPGNPGGLAHALNWTQAGGPVSLSAPGEKSSRINDISYDGSVSVGWEEEPFGNWQPHAWRGGVDYQLTVTEGWCQANAVNHDGGVVVGQTVTGPPTFLTANAAMWTWNGAGYDEAVLGILPGTPLGATGSVWADAVSTDGRIVIGTNRFSDNGPFSDETGFIWTPRTGMFDVVDYMADNGIALPANTMVAGMPAITPDGGTMIVLLKDLADPIGGVITTLLHIPTPCSAADLTTQGAAAGNTNFGMPDGLVTAADIQYYVNLYVLGDLNADLTTQGAGSGDPGFGVPDGLVTAADIQFYVNLYVTGCP